MFSDWRALRVFSVVVDAAWVDEDRVGVEQLLADVNLLLQDVHRQHDVLEHLRMNNRSKM